MIERIDTFMGSPRGKKIILIVGGILIAMLIFHAGVVVGSRHGFGDGFGLRRAPGGFFIARVPHGFIQNGHGTLGVVQSMDGSSITIATKEGGVQKVLIDEKTAIRAMNGDASTSALKVGSHVVILGEPGESGELSAHLIHLMPDTR